MKKVVIKIILFFAFGITAIYGYIDNSISNYKEVNSNESSLINNDYDDNKVSVQINANENNSTTIKQKKD